MRLFAAVAVVAAVLGSAPALQAQTLVTLAWNPNTEPNVAGYEVSYGTQSGVYSTTIDVGSATDTSISFPTGNLHYFAVRAYSASIPRLYSPYSAEVSFGFEVPAIAWSTPASIIYGTPLSTAQLNATTSVPGTFAYTPPSGTLLHAGADQTLSVTFTPTDLVTYGPATKSVTINVLKATPAVTWVNPPDINYGTALSATQLNATASVPGSFVYSPPAGTILLPGTYKLWVFFTPMSSDFASVSESVSVVVHGAPVITTEPSDQNVTAGTSAVFAAAASGNPVPDAQWQTSTNGGLQWTNLPGATGPTYEVVTTASHNGRRYRAVFTNSLGTAVSRAAILTVDAPGIAGDLDGDGRVEMLWRNQTGGANAVWDLDATGHVATGWLPIAPGQDWALVAAGDVDGDGRPDLLWRNLETGANVRWTLEGLVPTFRDSLDSEMDLDWQVMGAGDINRDGKSDLVWRNRVNGSMRVWYMNGSAIAGIDVMDPITDPAWAVAAIADVNGDGTADLILRNGATGENKVIFLGPAGTIGTSALESEPDLGWTIAGSGDVNGDGHLDLIWRHVLTGAFRLWTLNATTHTGTTPLSAGAPFTWTVAGNGSSAPGAPGWLKARAKDSSVSMAWTAPTTGGEPTTYVIESASVRGYADLPPVATAGTTTTIVLSGLASGRYLLRVRAVNGAGTSGPSNEVELVVGGPGNSGDGEGPHAEPVVRGTPTAPRPGVTVPVIR